MWIYTRKWGDVAQAKGVVFLIHGKPLLKEFSNTLLGFGEHSGRDGYEYLAQKLVEQSYVVWSMDHQGHGKVSLSFEYDS